MYDPDDASPGEPHDVSDRSWPPFAGRWACPVGFSVLYWSLSSPLAITQLPVLTFAACGHPELPYSRQLKPLSIPTVAVMMPESLPCVPTTVMSVLTVPPQCPGSHVDASFTPTCHQLQCPPSDINAFLSPLAAPRGPTGEEQRMDALVGLISGHPRPAGMAVLRSAFADGMDVSQRLLAMDAICAAAEALSGPNGRRLTGGDPRALPEASGEGPRGSPMQGVQERGVSGAGAQAGHGETVSGSDGGGKKGEYVKREGKVGRTRVWGWKSLALQQRGEARQWRNRLAEVVRDWAGEILEVKMRWRNASPCASGTLAIEETPCVMCHVSSYHHTSCV